MIKRIMIVTSIIICSFILYSCSGSYFGPGTSDYNYSLSGKYHLYKAGTAEIWSSNDVGGTKVIEADITGIAWNQDYILARQQIKKDMNYWIIEIKTNRIYGPFNEEDFKTQREKLKVNADLKLEYPVKYKNLEKSNYKREVS